MSKAKPVHAPMTQFAVVDDCLQIGGVPLTALAGRVGRTPFYAYDRNLMTQRVELLRRRLPADVQLHYAIKANPMPGVVQHLARLVDGLDGLGRRAAGGSRFRNESCRGELRWSQPSRSGRSAGVVFCSHAQACSRIVSSRS